ncbi:MAG TPA: hypothetical protein VJ878_01405 [Candidatus Izemoplasmatales bacterium]|nr:hypothetical protein [Candidatus Izemoplasmatales bacterium]
MDYNKFLTNLISLSIPKNHQKEKIEFIRSLTNTNKLHSDEYVLDIDHQKGVVKKQKRFPPDYEPETYFESFDEDRFWEIEDKWANILTEIYKTDDENHLAQLTVHFKKLKSASSFINQHKYYENFPLLRKLFKTIIYEIDLLVGITSNPSTIKKAKKRAIVGRKKDASAPQHKIREKVIELSKIKRFRNSDGTLKTTAIRDEIANKYSELQGKIGDRALWNRVKEVTKDLDGKNS